MDPEEISGAEVLAAVARVVDLPAYVEQTGGGCATVLVGYPGPEGEYTLAIGPGRFDWADSGRSAFWLADLYVGPDDHGTTDFPVHTVNSREELEPAIREALLDLDERFAEVLR